MARIFLIALGFVLAGFLESVATLLGRAKVVEWALAGVYTAAVVVIFGRVVLCWGGCGA
jgi:hypothetical protein